METLCSEGLALSSLNARRPFAQKPSGLLRTLQQYLLHLNNPPLLMLVCGRLAADDTGGSVQGIHFFAQGNPRPRDLSNERLLRQFLDNAPGAAGFDADLVLDLLQNQTFEMAQKRVLKLLKRVQV